MDSFVQFNGRNSNFHLLSKFIRELLPTLGAPTKTTRIPSWTLLRLSAECNTDFISSITLSIESAN